MSVPGLPLNPHTLWCDHHLAPFKARWPVGYLTASLALVEEAARLEIIMRACGGGEGRQANPTLFTAAIVEHGPLCCLLGDLTTARWTKLALAGDTEAWRTAIDELRKPTNDTVGDSLRNLT